MNKKFITKNNAVTVILLLIGIIGFILMSYNYILGKVRATYEDFNYEVFKYNSKNNTNLIVSGVETENLEGEDDLEVETDENPVQNNSQSNQTTKKTPTPVNLNYIGYLEIKKINLRQGFVDPNSKYNNVNKTIQIIKPSNMPDVENGNFILAGHAGSLRTSFFRNLHKVQLGDEARILYNGEIYIYKVVNIYQVKKTGQVEIIRNSAKTTLTLITCTKGTQDKQTVYIAELERKEVM